MTSTMRTLKVMNIAVLTLALAACGGSGEQKKAKEEGKSPTIKTQSATEQKDERPDDIPEVAEVTIEGDDQMQYNKDRIEVWEGQTVKLTLKHVGEMPVESMGHNWTLLKKGTDINTFGAASAQAKENDYLPPSMEDRVIAKTKTIGGGKQVTITFEAPPKGRYDFICAYPGHYASMQGKFIVK